MIDKNPHDRLDDAIDRTVRGMTDAAADDRAVARVMARVRETDRRAAETGWMLSPRVAWSGIVALLLMVLISRYSWHSFHRDDADRPAATTASQRPSSQAPSQQPPLAAREFPTRVVPAPSITQAATARLARRDALMPASVANSAADASDRMRDGRNAAPDVPPFESDIVVASITPAPLGDASPIHVAPLTTTALTMDEIPVPSIEVPSVSPE